MKKIIVLTIFCFLLFSARGFSQQGSYFSFQYEVSFGTGDLGDYISNPSWRGVLMEYRSAVKSNLMVGIDLGWNVFYEKMDYGTYTSGTESLSGTQYRYQNEVPILLSADYLILSDQALNPYIGLGIGTMYSGRRLDMGLYIWEEDSWHFALKGEAGILYSLGYGSSIKFAAKYYNGVKTGSLDSQGYFALSLGMAWTR